MGKTAFMPFEPEAQMVELPSRGVPYGSSGRIAIRPMTAREEKILASAKPNTYLQAIDKVMERCIKESQVSPEELTEGDRSFILLWLRINSYFPDYDVKLECPKCGKGFSSHIDLSELPIKVLDEGVQEPFHVRIGDYDVALRFLRGKDERWLGQIEEKLAQEKKGDTSDVYIYRYAKAIVSVNGEEIDFGTAKSFVESLSGRQMAKLRGAIKRMEHGVIFEKEIECPLCGKASEFAIPITAEFFLPSEPYDEPDNGETLHTGEVSGHSLQRSGVDGGE